MKKQTVAVPFAALPAQVKVGWRVYQISEWHQAGAQACLALAQA